MICTAALFTQLSNCSFEQVGVCEEGEGTRNMVPFFSCIRWRLKWNVSWCDCCARQPWTESICWIIYRTTTQQAKLWGGYICIICEIHMHKKLERTERSGKFIFRFNEITLYVRWPLQNENGRPDFGCVQLDILVIKARVNMITHNRVVAGIVICRVQLQCSGRPKKIVSLVTECGISGTWYIFHVCLRKILQEKWTPIYL